MKKIILALILLVSFINLGFAQAYEGTMQYSKKKQKAVVIDYAFPPEAVQNAFILKMEKLGYKVKEEKGILNRDKGFLVFNNAYLSDITANKMDVMAKVERKGRKDKDEAVLYVIMMQDNVNALDKMDAYDITRSKTFFNEMLPEVQAANLELEIKAQEELITKADKKLRGLKDDQSDLERKLKQNKSDQESTENDILKQKETLLMLQSKRTSKL